MSWTPRPNKDWTREKLYQRGPDARPFMVQDIPIHGGPSAPHGRGYMARVVMPDERDRTHTKEFRNA